MAQPGASTAVRSRSAGTVLVWEGVLGGQDYSGAFISAYLTGAGFTVDYTASFPGSLTGYDAVFLSFGNSGADGLSKTEFTSSRASKVKAYLEAGGKVYLEGGDALGEDQAGDDVLLGLFGLLLAEDGATNPIDQLSGQTGALTQGISFTGSSQVNSDFIDKYTPQGGVTAFVESGYGTVGVQFSGIYGQRTFCFSYALGSLPEGAGTNTPSNLMSQIVDFFELNKSPEISVSPGALSFTLQPGGSTTGTLTITNSGTGTLNWEIFGRDSATVMLALDDGRTFPAEITRETPELAGLLTAEFSREVTPPMRGKVVEQSFLESVGSDGVALVLDDGSRENAVGLQNGGQFIWLNQFTPASGKFPFTLNEVWVLFGSGLGVSVGNTVDIFIYQDTDGNLSNGATLMGSHTGATVQAVDDQTFSVYQIAPVTLNGPGDVIIAVVNRTAGVQAGQLPATLDQSSYAARSWIGTYSGDPSAAPALPATNLWGKTGTFGFPGNWMIRGRGFSSNDCPWLSESPFSGLLSPNSSQTVNLTVDANGLDLGTYHCNLVISSNDADEPVLLVPVTLVVDNRPPQITAIGSQTGNEGQTLQISVSATDPEGDAISLSAVNLPAFGSFTDNGNGSGLLTFSPGFLDAGSYGDIRIIASDDGPPVASDSISFALTVLDVNRAPVLATIGNQSVMETGTLDVAITATDPDTDNSLALAAANLPAFATFTDHRDGTASLRFTPGFDDEGSYPSISVTATDDAGSPLSDSEIFTLTVTNFNRAPAMSAISAQTVVEGAALVVSFSGSDPDGDALRFSGTNLPAFATLTDSGNGNGSITFAPGFDDAGTYQNLRVIVTDDDPAPLADSTTFQLTVTNTNRAPAITTIANQTVSENSILNVAMSASDPDGDAIQLFGGNLPPFGTFTDNGGGNGNFRFAPGFEDEGSYLVDAIARDAGNPQLADTLSFLVTVTNTNRPPAVTPIADASVNESATLVVAFSAMDPDGNGITFSTGNLPPFATLTDSGNGSGSLTFSPGFNDAGSYQNLQVIATDDGSPVLSGTASFNLTVNNVNQPPQITPIPDKVMDENAVLNVPIAAADADGDFVLLSAANLPAFALFTDNGGGNGNFRFTPGFNDAGSYTILAIARDTGSPQKADTVAFLLTVNNVNRTPVITPIPNQAMDENDILSVPVSANDPDGDTLTLTVNNLPAFGTFTDNGDGSGLLHFTAGADDAGNYPIEIIATDNGNPAKSATETFVLTVGNVNRPPDVTPVADQSVAEGATLSVPVSATDPDGNTLAITAAGLPSFGNLIDNGNGTALVQFSPGFTDAGEYSIEILATDNGAPPLSSGESFILSVTNVNRPPALTPLPDRTVNEGDTLAVPVFASDPDGDPLVLSAAGLPPFGSLTDHGDGTGTLTFTPGFDDIGQYSGIKITATDSGDPILSATDSLTLTVLDSSRAPLALDDQVQINEDDTIHIAVLANDSDPDADPLHIAEIFTMNTQGSVTIDPGDTTVFYRPPLNFFGTDQFRYLAADGRGGSDTATVTIEISPVNDPPALNGLPDSLIMRRGDSDTLNLWDAANDPETPDAGLVYAFFAEPDTLQLEFEAASGLLIIAAKNVTAPAEAKLIIAVSDPDGAETRDTVAVRLTDEIVAVTPQPPANIPEKFTVEQNYPNPFNPATHIRFGLPAAAEVTVEIYNLLGQQIAVPLKTRKPAGWHSLEFRGDALASGMYLYVIRAGNLRAVRKMILLK